ncbi:hypothetical protein [Streptomyces triculaminicus]|uniref:hypothetical protein n=1 Tax=Streptomyces triculaminicus TaxID=2816232 RepID=UPI00378AB1FC
MNASWATSVAPYVGSAVALAVGLVAYRSTRVQVQDRAAVEHRHWVRDNRFAAYQQFDLSFDTVLTALDQRRTNPVSGNRALLAALETMLRAQSAIGLAGPEELFIEAKSATTVVAEIRRYLTTAVRGMLPISPRDMVGIVNSIREARERFRVAATTAINSRQW